ncbi:PREDICTED: protein tyrosine phosphatase type IVA 3 isoform X1 [Cercocebus atys]|uniref:protein tyrosine phosphatase type IVA 3 isoform X1 n=1 Tax=Cercocebus atys TaxID=9531 RepID=UPI0005F48289|nr:PREDICTED: protein tyrosine phosphatase type IVA 3 isoform X1 [Cercocebus atys]XP_011905363.1 PREDICTED: protein tyrosine phosphatase type IVA 3 isoform X1 [Cercocebus atys]XP_011905364.1 PREDICTED: protein tyrosine phosphatase type IVA 3 isoform X1 [Cercocebus atys]XP_011905365.1 PREDICTED: protein tyrosine phosphatase type IVA 3 isoform X1 [Cercocebus atys]XP_011905366.1 PREDICTED: protein tyrosine phosphatase type IVA 3 isoform X1 [Cercocebus atys]XP_011905367.1 PREDICTED: protein tyrosi
MARMNRPAPVEVSYKHMRFLITHNPTNATLSTFIEDLKKYGATTVVRVCEVTYDKTPLEKDGITVVDWPFDDGAPPPGKVVEDWLSLVKAKFCEAPGSCVAVHCVAGLGRAPVLVALALIESGMKYEDAIQFIRQASPWARLRPWRVRMDESPEALGGQPQAPDACHLRVSQVWLQHPLLQEVFLSTPAQEAPWSHQQQAAHLSGEIPAQTEAAVQRPTHAQDPLLCHVAQDVDRAWWPCPALLCPAQQGLQALAGPTSPFPPRRLRALVSEEAPGLCGLWAFSCLCRSLWQRWPWLCLSEVGQAPSSLDPRPPPPTPAQAGLLWPVCCRAGVHFVTTGPPQPVFCDPCPDLFSAP